MKTIFKICVIGVIVANAVSCQPVDQLKHQHRSGLFTYYSIDRDSSTVREISSLMDSAYTVICSNLDLIYKHPVVVEVFPSQKSYDENIMNPQMRGTPAVSGNYKIQLVSPRSPIAIQGIPYIERLWFAVHEFAHLAIDQIPGDIPEWIDEGIACFEGSYKVYSYICLHYYPKGELPTLESLTTSYHKIPAADIYSFSLVEFLINRFGRNMFNYYIRHSQNPEIVFNTSTREIYKGWNDYVATHYLINK